MKAILLTLLFLATFAQNRIHMKDINSLVFHPGHKTAARRTSPIPQLECVGGTARSESHQVGTVLCTNMGSNGNGYNWKCDAQLSKSLKIGTHIDVNCEGYDYAGDPYILEGSCGLRYSLDYTGYHQQPSKPVHTVTQTTTTTTHPRQNEGVVLCIVFSVLLFMIFIVCLAPSPSHRVISSPGSHVIMTQDRSSSGSFVDGFVTGAVLSRPSHTTTYVTPPQVQTTTTTTRRYTSSDNSSGWGSGWGFGGGSSSSSDDTYTSSGYGTSSSR